ncbi:reverse transcriptase/maturase family protein [Pseudomonas sp. LJDD11]|nr:antiviral reverse transcriptase Drt2 [Pseudomonas sp. LJDD11]MCQ9423034.1 reverse transcriptase/maturase family protein [Pseudomonas sp. LJDD11]
MEDNTWFKARHYLHFDRPVGEKTACSYATDPRKVSRHSFYPFIRNATVTSKTKHHPHLRMFEVVEKVRPISYAAHMDSHIYAYYSSILSRRYEKKLERLGLSTSVLAFRALGGQSNIHHAHNAFQEIKARTECSVLCFDIEKFFDRLNHQLLKEAWKEILDVAALPADHYAVFKAITKHSYVERKLVYDALGISLHNPVVANKRLCDAFDFRNIVRGQSLVTSNLMKYGIPQGSPISAILSNMYMLDFDRAMLHFLSRTESVYYRYCDDIMIICPIQAQKSIEAEVVTEINKLLLNIQEAKTDIQRFTRDKSGKLSSERPIQYLGFMFDGERAFIRPASLTRYYRKMKVRVRLAKKAKDRINGLRRSRGEADKGLFLRALYKGYTHLGRRNFITYGYRAAKIMDSKTIRQQLRAHWRKLQQEINL